jgi:hypothetical protein
MLRALAAEATDALDRLAAHAARGGGQTGLVHPRDRREALTAWLRQQAEAGRRLERRLGAADRQVRALEESVLNEQRYALRALEGVLSAAQGGGAGAGGLARRAKVATLASGT